MQKIQKLISLNEATKILSVHANTLRNWEKAGLILPVRIGRRRDRRYTLESIRKFFENQ